MAGIKRVLFPGRIHYHCIDLMSFILSSNSLVCQLKQYLAGTVLLIPGHDLYQLVCFIKIQSS